MEFTELLDSQKQTQGWANQELTADLAPQTEPRDCTEAIMVWFTEAAVDRLGLLVISQS